MTKNLEDRARGMFIGLAVGDALGAPVQFGFDSDYIRAHIKTLQNLHDNPVLPKGIWTDDTSMALCIADSLLERGGYDSYDLMEKFCSWENLGYRSYFDYGYDVGAQVDRAICEYAKSPAVAKDAERTWKAGNGSIMRLAPTILAACGQNNASHIDAKSPNPTSSHPDPNLIQAVKLAWLSGRETHYSTVAECGSEVFANLLYRALKSTNGPKTNQTNPASIDQQKSQIVRLDDLYFTSDELKECWLDNSWLIENRIHSDGACLRDLGGYVMDAITIAIWGFIKTANFEEGMLEVLKLGGDTDTNCAIYGQLAGAFYGFSAIPERWVKDLYLASEIINLADQLIAMPSCLIIRTRFEEDDEDFSPAPEIKS